MFHNAKQLERLTFISAGAAFAATVLLAPGCATYNRGRTVDPRASDGEAAASPSARDERIVDEELVGPPSPAPADLEGPPEPVGPPAPTAREEIAPAAEPEPQARVTEPDRALMADLAGVGAEVHPSARGPVVVLPDTIFELGTATLQREAKRKIHEIGRVVSQRAFRSRVAVEGHSDSTGAEMYNRGLSERRANAVAAELSSAGIAKKLLTAKGYGSQFPIAPNERGDGSDDAQGRARNRRVEVVVETTPAPGA